MKYVGVVVGLVLLAYLVMEFNHRTAELNRLKSDQELVSQKLDVRRQTFSALEAKIAYATSDAAVLEWAYENHYAQPGDFVIAPEAGMQVTPTPSPEVQVTATQVSNWEKWLMLFFDPGPVGK